MSSGKPVIVPDHWQIPRCWVDPTQAKEPHFKCTLERTHISPQSFDSAQWSKVSSKKFHLIQSMFHLKQFVEDKPFFVEVKQFLVEVLLVSTSMSNSQILFDNLHNNWHLPKLGWVCWKFRFLSGVYTGAHVQSSAFGQSISLSEAANKPFSPWSSLTHTTDRPWTKRSHSKPDWIWLLQMLNQTADSHTQQGSISGKVFQGTCIVSCRHLTFNSQKTSADRCWKQGIYKR